MSGTVELALVVAGRRARLEHRAVLTGEGTARWRLAVHPGEWRELAEPADHLTAAVARLTGMRPRRLPERAAVPFPADRLPGLVAEDDGSRAAALGAAGAELAWHLRVRAGDDAVTLTATDGPRGLFLADDDHLRPVSNTQVYRVLSTVLPLAAGLTGRRAPT